MQELRMSYRRDCGNTIEYTLRTDPQEAMYWTTHKLKKGEIVILTTGISRSEKALIRKELVDDINTSDKNPHPRTGEYPSPTNKIQKKH